MVTMMSPGPTPKLTFPEQEAAFLQNAYAEAKVILEYGSGGSTMMASAMPGKRIFSVESDYTWAVELQRSIHAAGMPSPATIYHADIGPTGAWGRPTNDRAWAKFYQYPSTIWSETFFRHPDTILIDGRFRPACLIAAMLSISRPVRVLFDDYRDRPAYSIVENVVKPTRMVGRMAEFVLEPGGGATHLLDFFGYLCTLATYSSEPPPSYSYDHAAAHRFFRAKGPSQP